MNDHDLLGVYALDAIDDPEEIARVEALLETSAEAREELVRLREVAALLGPTREAAATPVWDRISDSIDTPLPPLDVQPLGRPRRGRRRLPSLAVAAAVVGLVVALGAGILAGRVTSSDRSTDLTSAAEEAAERDDAEQIPLVSDDGEDLAEIVYLLGDGTGYVRALALEPLPPGRTYQLWALVGDVDEPEAISAGVLGSDPEISAFRFDGPVVGFALTIEAEPGVVSSNVPPTASGLVA